MTDKTELKRLAEAATQGEWTHFKHGVIKGGPAVKFANGSTQCQIAMTVGAEWMREGEQGANADFIAAANPVAIKALIAEIETLEGPHGWLAEDLIKELVNNAQAFQENSDHGDSDPFAITLLAAASRIHRQEANIDKLKAENEALRDDIEQNQYDANAWRNGEESVWIEVFNSEDDDPFISAITGQITVEQLTLIQAEILEYREDYFEKGSGLYVFKCRHCQAHHDNVGMTEPAHWETDFESYSPFPWEEEVAATTKEQSHD